MGRHWEGEDPLESRLAVLITAGGKGERFWPRSRTELPKQFLRLCGTGTLLQETFRRARHLVPVERIFIVTPRQYRDLTLQQLPDLPRENLILEPMGRDTAAAIGLGAVVLEGRDPEASMIVLPADHVIANEERFLAVLTVAGQMAGRGRHLVTIGITPTRPETGYGYIHCGEAIDHEGGQAVLAVRRFTEKPAHDQALRFLKTGEYLWNSGIFTWKVSTLRAMIAAHLPWLHEGLERIAGALATPGQDEVIEKEFSSFQEISIDYGLMERAENVVVVPGDFGWDDVGNWAALERVHQPDKSGNILFGRVAAIDTDACIVFSGTNEDPAEQISERLVVTYGVDGLLIVDTPDVLLVADKTQSANLKQVVEEVCKRGYSYYVDEHQVTSFPLPPRFLDGKFAGSDSVGEDDAPGFRVVNKPWGQEIWWAETERYVGKIIEVKAGHSLSLQYHRVKLETLLFTRGKGTLVLGNQVIPIREGLCVSIPPGTAHRVLAQSDVLFYEVSSPETEDTVRLEDSYGRSAVGGQVIHPPEA